MEGEKTDLVAALNAPVNVMNHDGLLVANVMPGMPMSFLTQAASPGVFESFESCESLRCAGQRKGWVRGSGN